MAELTFKEKRRRSFDFDLFFVILRWVLEIAFVCVLAFVLVWYFGQRVQIVGSSMQPKYENGDKAHINRIIYNISSPKRGDIIAFHPNGNENAYCYVRRIVGLPGETVELKDGKIYINGKEITEDYATTAIEDIGIADEPVFLGSDEYFVLGDDRQSVEDSRSSEIGNVRRSEIEGKVW